MPKLPKNIIDNIVIVVGLILLGLYIAIPDNRFMFWLAFIPGIVGLHYIAKPICLFFKDRVKFDWYLINGNFLKKVCCIVLLIPFVFLMFIHVYNIVSEPCDICAISSNMSKESSVLSQQHLMDSEDMYLNHEYNDDPCHMEVGKPSLFWTIYYHFIDPGNQHMATSGKGRPWAALIGILGAFLLNGLLVSSIIGYIDKRKEMWENGEIRYGWNHLGNFAIVIGANEIISTVIKNLLTPVKVDCINNKCECNNDYIILQTCRVFATTYYSIFCK